MEKKISTTVWAGINPINAQVRVNLLCERNRTSCSRVGHRADFFPAATVGCPTLIKLI